MSLSELLTQQVNKTFVWGGGIGFFSGIIGVGGYFLISCFTIKKVGRCKNRCISYWVAVFIFLNSLAGLTGNLITGQNELDVSILFSFATVVLIGGFIGSLYGSRFASQKHVRMLLVIVLFVAAIKRVLDLFGF